MTPRRVLVIDDNEQIGVMLERGLALRGFEVVVAQTGFAGRAAWEAGSFDIVLLDVMLPHVDGVSLCAERRAAGDTTPVLLLTGRDDPNLRQRGLQAGANDVILKPFSYADLINRIDELMGDG